jgi:hypothetical protein
MPCSGTSKGVGRLHQSTISELARAHGLRRSRYRSFAKVQLQNLLIGTACNVKRWLQILAVTKIGSKIQLLPFRKSIYWIPRFFRTLRLSLNLVSHTVS